VDVSSIIDVVPTATVVSVAFQLRPEQEGEVFRTLEPKAFSSYLFGLLPALKREVLRLLIT